MIDLDTTREARVVSPFFEMQELIAKHQWLSEMRQRIFNARRSGALRIGLADGVIAKLGASKVGAYMYNRKKKTLKLLSMFGTGNRRTIREKGFRIASHYADLPGDRCIFECDVNNRRNSIFARAREIPEEGYEWLESIIDHHAETPAPVVDTSSTDRNPFLAFAYAIDDSASIVFKVRRESFPPMDSPDYKEFTLSCDALLSQIRNKLVDSSIRMNRFELESAAGTNKEIPKLGVSYLGVPEEMLFQTITKLSQYTSGCHFDVMDGLYVEKYGTFDIDGTVLPKSDFPFVTHMMIESMLQNAKLKLFIDAHLMVYDPVPYIIEYGYAKVDAVTVSYRRDFMQLRRQIALIQQMGMLAGVAIKPKHQLDDIEDILPDLDILLIMTVEPGKGGQPFIREMLPKITNIKKHIEDQGLTVKIQVDGGINEETGPLALGAGADLLVSGSTMVKSPRPQETYRKILGIPDLTACPPTT
jgi:ribulose-phosphate 3-epimerase